MPMPENIISRINKLALNETNQFIFTYRRGCPIGDVEITGEDRDADDSNETEAPQDPPHEFQVT